MRRRMLGAAGIKFSTSAAPARRMTGMGDARGRNAVFFLTGLGVLCLSFWITLTVIDSGAENRPGDVQLADVPLTNNDGSPHSARASTMPDLPPAPTGFRFSVAWDGIEGLNALIMGPGPTGGGNRALSLVATRDGGRHRLGIAVVGVPVNRPIRATAWIKAPRGTRIGVDVRDGEELGHAARNTGSAALDLSPRKVLAASGNVRASVEAGPSDWVKVPIEMPSSDGVFVIYFGLLGPGNNANFSGAGEQMIFGGIEITVG
jgi:hypothetical protein